MKVDTDDVGPPRVHPRDDERDGGCRHERPLQARARRTRSRRSARWLRKTSLDELPQLSTCFAGEMSLVGPRPCIPYETEHFEPHHFERFLVPAGITGLWQVTARAQLDVRRGARHGRRLRARLVARARPPAPLPDADRLVRQRTPRDVAPRSSRLRTVTATPHRVDVAVVGLGYWGPNLVRNLHELAGRRARRASATSRPEALDTIAAPLSRRSRHERRRSHDVLDDPTRRRRRDRDARSRPITRSPRPRSRPASTSSSRSRSRRPSTRRRELVELAERAGLVLMPGHTFLYSPPVNVDPRADRVGRARRDLLHLDEPREPRPAPVRRERRLGSRPARLLDPPLLARRDAAHVERAQPRLHHARHPRRRVHQPRVPLGDDRARRALLARAEQAPPNDDRRLAQDGRLRRHEHRAGARLRLGRRCCATRRRSASTSSPTAPATSSRRTSTPPSRSALELRDFCRGDPRRGGRRAPRRSSASRSSG